jgi:hypothetical protein
VIHDLDRILAPADPETLVPDVQATLAVCAARERSGDDVAMLIAVLARELADLPGFAVRAALARWRRSEKWWPSLAELRHLAFVEARDLLELRDWLARPPPAAPKPPPEPRCTPAEAAAILAVHGIVPAPNRNVEQQFDDTPTTPPEAWERLAEETADG